MDRRNKPATAGEEIIKAYTHRSAQKHDINR